MGACVCARVPIGVGTDDVTPPMMSHRHITIQHNLISPSPLPSEQNIFDPLKMVDTGFAVPMDKINR